MNSEVNLSIVDLNDVAGNEWFEASMFDLKKKKDYGWKLKKRLGLKKRKGFA